jgi:hypothetical protein
LNAWLADQCVAYAKRTRHPEFRERMIFEVFEEERPRLMAFLGPFAGFIEKPMPSADEPCEIPATPHQSVRPLRDLVGISGGELARWVKITTPNDRLHVIRVLETTASILRGGCPTERPAELEHPLPASNAQPNG